MFRIMLDIMTLMASMQLQSEMKQLRKETRGLEEDKPVQIQNIKNTEK